MKRNKCAPAFRAAALLLALLLLLFLASTPIAGMTETAVDPYEDSELTEDGRFVGMYDLFQYWKRTEYPDYVCGVWVLRSGPIPSDTGIGTGNETHAETYAVYDETDANGNRTRTRSSTRAKSNTIYYFAVGVTQDEAGEAGKEEILSLIAIDETARFCYQTYPMYKLQGILNTFTSGSYEAYGLLGAYHYARGNRVDLYFDTKCESNPDTLALIERIKREYGDMVSIDFAQSIVDAEDIEDPILFPNMQGNANLPPSPSDPPISHTGVKADAKWMLLLPVPLVLLLALVLLTRRRARLALLSSGETTIAAPHLTRKATEALLRESSPEPPSELDRRIYEEIEKI